MEYIERIANQLKEQYGTKDPFVICDALDIVVLAVDLGKNIRGFYQKLLGTQLIYINTNLNYREKDIVCAHELAHAILHPACDFYYGLKQNDFVCARLEREADIFCAHLLIEDDEIQRAYIDRSYETYIRDFSRITGIPERIVELKFKHVG